jgi:hypothetical protein
MVYMLVQVSFCPQRLIHCSKITMISHNTLLHGDPVDIRLALFEPVPAKTWVDKLAEGEEGHGNGKVNETP